MTESALIQGCKDASNSHQKVLFQQYAAKLLTVCRRYARNQAEAEDMLQDAFIRIFDNIHQYKNEGSFEGWLRRVTVNVALRNYKKSCFTQEIAGLEAYQELADHSNTISSLEAEEILKIIATLPDGYRVVFNLYAIEGYSHLEIAEQLGIQESTSRSQLSKARTMLQQKVMALQHYINY